MSSLPPPTAVDAIDLPRYLGTWYEIARLPIRFEPEQCTDVSAQYSLSDAGTIRVQNRCRTHDGDVEEAIGEATPAAPGASRLQVSFLPAGLRWIPFTRGDYWVLRVDPAYAVALIGSPDRRYLWLLSRNPVLPEEVRERYLGYARAEGYDLEPLILTPHTGRPTASPTH